jgi:uncharacterized protein (TIGR03089 family)
VNIPEQAFAELLRTEPAHPFVTYYDEATGERTELSVKSLANWVAKTHHLLVDDLDLGVGDIALVATDAHWIAYPMLLGCLTAGLALTSEAAAQAAVAFVDPRHAALPDGVPDVYSLAPDSAAVGFRDAPPAGANDYVSAVRPQPDKWASVFLPAAETDPCLGDETRADVMTRARHRADELGLRTGARLLSTADWTGADAWRDALFVPLAIGGSAVLVRNASPQTLARRAEQERVDLVR